MTQTPTQAHLEKASIEELRSAFEVTIERVKGYDEQAAIFTKMRNETFQHLADLVFAINKKEKEA